MATSLLQTKLYVPPPRPELVPRPRLIERLNTGMMRKVTLISAPAGFGKSTLVTGWLAESGRPAAWLSLDEGDNDPVRFWAYLIAAVQAVHPEMGEEARQIIGSPQWRSAEPAVISLINDISKLTPNLILVLDDYHVIKAGRIHDRLNYLLENQPPNLHIVLITRVDPPLSLARLRGHGQLLEIRPRICSSLPMKRRCCSTKRWICTSSPGRSRLCTCARRAGSSACGWQPCL
jgi:LuxR family maltose regulon positive regulatory protein